MKYNYVFSKHKEKLVRGVTLFSIFANLFSFWLNRRQLEPHTCFCIQSAVVRCLLEVYKEILPAHMGSWTC